jgi:energy-coupling factor transport system permease protein
LRNAFNNFDVRTKLAIVAGISTTAVVIQDVYVLSFLLIISILLSAFFFGDIKKTLRATRRLWYLFLAIVILQSIFNRSGSSLLTIGDFTILTDIGLLRGAEFLLRISVILFSATIVASSDHREVVQGLVQLKIPYEFAFMVSVGIRFLPLLRSEFIDVMTAIQLRGIDIKKIPFKKRLKVYTYIFTPIMTGAINKARNLSIAMEARAFRAYPERTSYLVLKLVPKDYIVMIITLLCTAAVFTLYYLFGFPGRIL